MLYKYVGSRICFGIWTPITFAHMCRYYYRYTECVHEILQYK